MEGCNTILYCDTDDLTNDVLAYINDYWVPQIVDINNEPFCNILCTIHCKNHQNKWLQICNLTI